MTVAFIELLIGLYFIGASILVVKNGTIYNKSVDIFKLVYGIALVLLALSQGTKLI
jgi:hypothetical protein